MPQDKGIQISTAQAADHIGLNNDVIYFVCLVKSKLWTTDHDEFSWNFQNATDASQYI